MVVKVKRKSSKKKPSADEKKIIYEAEVIDSENNPENDSGILEEMTKLRKGVDDHQEIETKKKNIYQLVTKGLSWDAIARVIGLPIALCQHFYRAYQFDTFENYTKAPKSALIGDALRKYELLEQEAMREMALSQTGTAQKLSFMGAASKALNEKLAFMEKMGIIKKDEVDKDRLQKRLGKSSTSNLEKRLGDLQAKLSQSAVNSVSNQHEINSLKEENLRLRRLLAEQGLSENEVFA